MEGCLAIILARGGSKGIPNKNMREVAGVSLVSRAVAAALASSRVDYVSVSSDSPDLLAHVSARFPDAYLVDRPESLAGDKSKSIDAWKHCFVETQALIDVELKYTVLLEPTSPCRTSGDIDKCIFLMQTQGEERVATFSRLPKQFNPEKLHTISEQDGARYYDRDGSTKTIRQDLPDYYYRNGVCYGMTRKELLKSGDVFDGRVYPMIIERPLVSIDEEIDLAQAENILKSDG